MSAPPAAIAFYPKGACSPLDVLDRVRMMLARKRGPKKGSFVPARNPNQAEHFDQPAARDCRRLPRSQAPETACRRKRCGSNPNFA